MFSYRRRRSRAGVNFDWKVEGSWRNSIGIRHYAYVLYTVYRRPIVESSRRITAIEITGVDLF